MRRLVACGVSWLAATTACTRESDPVLSGPFALAVGSTSTGWVSFNRCTGHGHDGTSCDEIRVALDSVEVNDPSVLELRYDDDNFWVTALAAGSTTLTAIADGDVYTREILSAVPDRVTAELTSVLCRPNAMFGFDEEVSVDFELFAGTRSLDYDLETNPLTAELLIPVTGERIVADFGKARFRTPAVAGLGVVGSPLDPTLTLPITVFAPADVTGIELPTIASNHEFHVHATKHELVEGAPLLIGDAVTCEDHYPRTVRSVTPTCAIWDGSANVPSLAVAGRERFFVAGVAAGDCAIEVSLDGTSVLARYAFPIAPAGVP